MSEKYHEFIKPMRDMFRGVGERVLNLVVPEGTFDDFLAGGPLDTPMPGEVGGVPTNFDYQAYEHATLTVPSVDGKDL